jgi:hypothetical protein
MIKYYISNLKFSILMDINPNKFKLKVTLPKVVKSNKEELSKKDVIELLNNCS